MNFIALRILLMLSEKVLVRIELLLLRALSLLLAIMYSIKLNNGRGRVSRALIV
jgi:hypothetical protein